MVSLLKEQEDVLMKAVVLLPLTRVQILSLTFLLSIS